MPHSSETCIDSWIVYSIVHWIQANHEVALCQQHPLQQLEIGAHVFTSGCFTWLCCILFMLLNNTVKWSGLKDLLWLSWNITCWLWNILYVRNIWEHRNVLIFPLDHMLFCFWLRMLDALYCSAILFRFPYYRLTWYLDVRALFQHWNS